MLLKFTKMHGLGNDFVVIDAIHQDVALNAETIRRIADRRFGVGCDQLLMVERPRTKKVQFRYRIFNADGSEVEQCGNGARCFAKFVHDKELTRSREIPVETSSGVIVLRLLEDNRVQVDMGVPILRPSEIPFSADQQSTEYELQVDEETVTVGAVSMGNPHAVLVVKDASTAPVAWLGPKIERHQRFPKRVNVGFMQVESASQVRLRVYERGAGETLACGTGACAAMVSGRLRGLLDSEVTVHLPGGALTIEWAGEGKPVLMTGPAETVYEGEIRL